jgi:hypothetical protein
MFTVKHAIMEILNKSKTLDEVLEPLDAEDQATVLAAFDLMKAKLGGTIDVMDTQDNGQWSLAKNTLDYSKINAPKPRDEPANTLDYSKMSSPVAKKPWAGAVARRDAERAKNKKWVDAGAVGSGETDDKSAMDAIRDRQLANKSEDNFKELKDKYADKKQKPINEMVADVKEKYSEKKPKSDDQKITEAKDKFRTDEKLKAEKPIKTATKLAKPKTS